MPAKWSGLASNTTAGNRLANIGMAATQLSTGDLIMLVWDPSLTLPNQITLQVVTGHTSPSVVAFINQDQFETLNFPQNYALCRDASDNIFVIGSDNVSGHGFELVAQAFQKQSGLAWNSFPVKANVTPAISRVNGISAVWCNTGGGAGGVGHVLAIANNADGSTRYQIFSVANLLSPTSLAATTAFGTNPSFLWVNGDTMTVGMGSNIDMDANGFGATSGLSLSAGNLDFGVGAWGVSPTGVLLGPGMLSPGIGSPITATTKGMMINYANNRWAAAYPSSQHAGQLTITGLTGSGLAASTLTACSVDTGTPTNFPTAFSSTLSWGAIAGPPNSATVWIYGWSTATNTTMLRLPVVFTPAGVPSITPANIVTDDTGVGAATNSTIRVVDDVVDFQHADWQAFDTVSTTLSLLGDYSALPSAPAPVTLVSPANNALIAAAGTYTWNYNPAFPGDAQVTKYVRYALQPGSAYQWWNGTTLQGTEIAITSAISSATLAGGLLTPGSVYSWTVDVTGTSGIRAGYASPQFVGISNTVPSQPTLTATYDSVNNRVTLVIAGTGTDSAIFQYSDDGTNWFNVRGATAVVQVAGAATVFDWEIPANATRSYRVAQFTTAGIGSLPSAWSATQTATSVLNAFWLSDPLAQSVGINPHVLKGTLTTSFNENLAEHALLGRSDTVILGDVIGLEDGACTFATYTTADENALLTLIKSQRILLFMAPDGRTFYTRWNVPRPVNTPYLVRTGSYREHALSFRGQQRPPS